jgi:hypothetical protein
MSHHEVTGDNTMKLKSIFTIFALLFASNSFAGGSPSFGDHLFRQTISGAYSCNTCLDIVRL